LDVPDGVGFFHKTKVDANRKHCFFVPLMGTNYRIPPILPAMTHLKPGDAAPAFQSIDQNEAPVALSDFAGKKLVLYFYPKDDTPGCTAEACSFRDSYQELLDAGFAILGVSVDSPKAHQKFIAKYSLPFPLLSDGDKSVVTSYGVWGRKKFMGREYDGIHRVTFVIDGSGSVERVITDVDTKAAAQQILADSRS
jgi:peroxiredoxin Q/BCP